MREALVSRHGQMGQLLNCVTELEAGEDGPARGFVSDAGDIYLEALMWANGAAESLFGGPAASSRARSAPAAATRRRPRHTAEPVASKPPPGPAAVAALVEGASGPARVSASRLGSVPERVRAPGSEARG